MNWWPDYARSFEPEWANFVVQIGLPARALRDIVDSGSLEPHLSYRDFHRPKKTGGLRLISEPDAKLKELQTEIARRYFLSEACHPAATAYRAGHSTADHVWRHVGAAVLIVADVRDFFPTTSTHRVSDWWHARTDDDTARLLTLLTTHRGGLPQGAPTSPALSNFVNRDLDERLTQRVESLGGRYSRYCDDLCFSWPSGDGPPSDFERTVRALLHEFGYELRHKEGWRVYCREDEPEVTGVVLTRKGGVRLPERLQRIMAVLAGSGDPEAGQRLEGYRAYRKMVTRRPKRLAPRPMPKPEPLPQVEARFTPSDEDDIPF